MRTLLLAIVLVVTVFSSCERRQVGKTQQVKYTKISINLQLRPSKKQFTIGDSVRLVITISPEADSIKLYANDSLLLVDTQASNILFTYKTHSGMPLGKYRFNVTAFKQGRAWQKVKAVTFLSDFEPKHLTYRVKAVYPHDPQAYTQGLVYVDDTLFESTGLKGSSSIRKVKLETGQILQSYTIEPQYFGEGITVWGNRLYQLTWQARVGFVYSRYNFQKLAEFTYLTEGWGLTHDDNYLIMSDGSNIITFLDPRTFLPVRQIQVYDNKKPRTLLNELEFINGKIYANIYTKDLIAVINPKTGAVEAYIDMSGLLSEQDRTRNTDVLNGIAFDKVRNRIFVTGKNWPKLFEVQFVNKY